MNSKLGLKFHNPAANQLKLPDLYMSKKKKKKFSPISKKKSGNKKINIKSISQVFQQKQNRPLNHKQINAALGGTKSDSELVIKLLHKMLSDKKLVSPARGKFQLASFSSGVKTGVLQGTKRGIGYVVTDEREDVFIDNRHMGQALDGDKVEVRITGSRSGQPSGKIERVIERATTTFVGVIEISENFAFVVPSNPRIHVDFFVPKKDIKAAKNGQKVIVELTEWPEETDNPAGKVVEVLGNPGEHNVEMHAIMAEFGLPMEFPDEVLRAADKTETTITDEEIANRRDFRKVTTFTIDPDDAKDFDDALSVEFLNNGNIRVGVHIADVTHYLLPDSILDQEAIRRATSVYLVDRVVPMLPEILSNLVCSLRPDEDKLCFSAVFELDQQARVISEWYGKTVIRSNHRFTYDTAQQVLDSGEGPFSEELSVLLKLSKIMRQERVAHGAIEFGGSEVKFELDKEGRPVGVKKKIMKDTNRLIEDFMLLANKKVAAKVGKVKQGVPKPFVYRVHDEPDTDKLIELKAFAKRFGHEFSGAKNKGAAFAITRLLKDVEGQPEEDIIRHMAIRSMAKAYYSTDNVGHYGLSFEYYTHFTSPIRRYPDVLVHRQLQHYLQNEKAISEEELDRLSKHCSIQERKATEAERASIKYKQVEFMLDKVGEEFAGIITGLTNWGIYVEIIETSCEGMISLQSMEGDHYTFDEDKYQIVGNRYGEVFSIGDQIDIRVVRGDLVNKQLDFEFVAFRE